MGDGRNEIWAGDAAGHIFLFYYDSTTQAWQTYYQSPCWQPYSGVYNNFYPIKVTDPTTGKITTKRLAVVSAGYVALYDVDLSGF